MYQDNGWKVDPKRSRLFIKDVTVYKDTKNGTDAVTTKYRYSYSPRVEHPDGQTIKKFNSKGVLVRIENISEESPDSIDITEDVYINKDSRVRLGQGYVMLDLIYEMMMISDNDAAYALAKHVAGDTLRFYDLMNQKAQYLGMDSTHFANPNGMPNDNNFSSAADLIKLARYAMRDTMFASIVGTAEKAVPLTDGRHLDCRNSNALLHTYEGCIGIKTGFTYQAGYCLASAATRNGHTLYLVLLKSRRHHTRFTESVALLDYGFRVMDAYRQRINAH
jgi:D-alanyl-D-alanine carboxypeptidase/D-alanyl-D-alanine carboxypeptidase (penicillin-binding protein 5/6)